MFQYRELVPTQGKYTLANQFSKGYLQEIKSLREYYGQPSSFQNLNISRSLTNKKDSLSPPKQNILNSSQKFDKFINDLNKPALNTSLKSNFSAQKKSRTLQSTSIRFGSSVRKERFEQLDLIKPSNFANEYSNINFLIASDYNKNPKANKFYDSNFIIKEKNYEKDKLNLQYENLLSNAKNKRDELKITKENKEKFRKWKDEFMKLQKKFRVCKDGFKSGIINIDNPLNECTKLYKNEFEQIKKKELAKFIINDKHKKTLKELTKTNENIEFFNRTSKKFFFN